MNKDVLAIYKSFAGNLYGMGSGSLLSNIKKYKLSLQNVNILNSWKRYEKQQIAKKNRTHKVRRFVIFYTPKKNK